MSHGVAVKAARPILVKLLGIEMDVREEQLKNAKFPMLVTLSGMVIEVMEEQP